MKWLVTKKMILTEVIEANSKQEAIDAFDETKASSDSKMTAHTTPFYNNNDYTKWKQPVK